MKYLLFLCIFLFGYLVGSAKLSSKESSARESTSKTICWVQTSFSKRVEAQFGPAPKGFKYCMTFKGPAR